MNSGAVSDREAVTAALDRFEAAQAEVAALSFDALTAPEVLNVKDRLETVSRRQAAVDHRLTHRISGGHPASPPPTKESCCLPPTATTRMPKP
jgi:hypothetical protein